jgi:large subunit ribosomal protein L9
MADSIKAKTKTKKAAPAAKAEPAKKEKGPPKKKVHNHPPRGPHGGLQLLLVEDVEHLGKTGEMVEVKAGYARNYLLPYGLATYVTPHNLRRLQVHKIKVDKMREAKLADLRAQAEQLNRQVTDSSPAVIEAQANEQGHLYGSVGAPEIAVALRAMRYNIDPEHVRLDGAIKEMGLYAVKLQFSPEIETSVKVLVVPQQKK